MHEKQAVYVLAGNGKVKIGRSGTPYLRASDLSQQEQCELIYNTAQFKVTEAGKVERIAHRLCADHRLKGEWFALTPDAATKLVKDAVRIFRAGKGDEILAKKEFNDYNYQRLNIVLRPADQQLVLRLIWLLEQEAGTRFSQSDIIRLALREMAKARGVECK